MTRADYNDKQRIVQILSNSFDDNKSVNYIVRQDHRRNQRIRHLMSYAFDTCFLFGEVYITEDKNGCALVLFPDKKKTTLRMLALDLKLAISGIGPGNLFKAISREAKISAGHPTVPFYYIWFIGVDSASQRNGLGSSLLLHLMKQAAAMQRPACLETSAAANIPWYQRNGFEIYRQIDFGFTVSCMKKEWD